jgi:hypothetical protein
MEFLALQYYDYFERCGWKDRDPFLILDCFANSWATSIDVVACSGFLSGRRRLKRGKRRATPRPSSSTRPAAAVCCRDRLRSAKATSNTSMGLNQIGGDSFVMTNAEEGRSGKQFTLSVSFVCPSISSFLESR